MKKYAWTLAEMVIVIIILFMLSGLCVSLFKPDTQKAKICLYAAIRNITRGNITIIEKYETLMKHDDPEAEEDWYCTQFADAFTLDTEANCSKDADEGDINIRFAHGVTIQGLASDWVQPFADSSYYYKNIVVDIDGSDGMNRLWVDRFPLRIISGSNKGAEGLVVTVTCGDNDLVYNDKAEPHAVVAVAPAAKNPYCSNGFTPSGDAVNKNFALSKDILTYDVYRAISTEPDSKAELITTSVSPMEADCMAYGDQTGYYSTAECDSAKIRIKGKCATKQNCGTCTNNTCPMNQEGTSATDHDGCSELAGVLNPNDISCFAIVHKPSGGASFMLQALIGDIDEFEQ